MEQENQISGYLIVVGRILKMQSPPPHTHKIPIPRLFNQTLIQVLLWKNFVDVFNIINRIHLKQEGYPGQFKWPQCNHMVPQDLVYTISGRLQIERVLLSISILGADYLISLSSCQRRNSSAVLTRSGSSRNLIPIRRNFFNLLCCDN